MLTAFRSLEHRNFRLFFAGQSVSLIGTWMQRLAVSWLVYSATHSSLLLGVVLFAGQIPMLLLAPYGGTVADRYSRYRILLTTQVAALGQASLLAGLVLSGYYNTWVVACLSLLLGTINAFDIPARQSLLVELVDDPTHLPNAIALNSTMVNLARLLGPAVAGALLALLGAGPCFAVNALSFGAVIGSLLLMRLVPRPPRARRPGAWEGLREGWAYLRQAPALRRQLLLMAGLSFCVLPFGTLLPVFAQDVFHGAAGTFGLLNSVSGAGALAGALYLASRPAGGQQRRLISWAGLGFCVSLLGFALSPQLGVGLGFIGLGGVGMMLFIAGTNTFVQTHVPDHLRGRVLSYYVMAFQGMQPLGSLLVGWLARHLGAPHTVLLQGAAGLLVLLALGRGPRWARATMGAGRPGRGGPRPRRGVGTAYKGSGTGAQNNFARQQPLADYLPTSSRVSTPMAAPTPIAQLDATLDTLQGGLIKITDAAGETLAGWIKTLHGNAALSAIARELQVLQDAITANHRGTIADSLSKLSEQTKGAAITATPDAQSKLFQLSDALKLAAGQVG